MRSPQHCHLRDAHAYSRASASLMNLLTFSFFFFNDPATTEIYTLSLHDALPISSSSPRTSSCPGRGGSAASCRSCPSPSCWRSEEHTSELQSHHDLVCRLLLEKKKNTKIK